MVYIYINKFLYFFINYQYYYQFDINVRTTLFWVYIILFSTVLVKFIFIPISKLVQIGSILTHKEAAKIIGKHFPEIEDKLLNYLELSEMNNNQNELINASIEQKISLITPFSFNKVRHIKNKKQVMDYCSYCSNTSFLYFRKRICVNRKFE